MILSFLQSCLSFNRMYRLPVADHPTLDVVAEREPVSTRLANFATTLRKEIDEVEEIRTGTNFLSDTDLLVMIADLLADIVVYSSSEAVKYGIPLDRVLRIVMMSNASKLNPDGTASYDERGKVLKGPNYWKPEPMILDLIVHGIILHPVGDLFIQVNPVVNLRGPDRTTASHTDGEYTVTAYTKTKVGDREQLHKLTSLDTLGISNGEIRWSGRTDLRTMEAMERVVKEFASFYAPILN